MVGLGRAEGPPTAVFFDDQTAEALVSAMLAFEVAAARFAPAALRARAEQFDRPVFAQRLRDYLDRRYAEFRARLAC